jgi:hypothetical protein
MAEEVAAVFGDDGEMPARSMGWEMRGTAIFQQPS